MPAKRDALLVQRDELHQKAQRLLSAIECGESSAMLVSALRLRESEIATIESELARLDAAPERKQIEVLPTAVRERLGDVAALLTSEMDQAKALLSDLGVRFVLTPVFRDGSRPYLRAAGEGDFAQLGFAAHVRLSPR